jgi:hypothetical protein
MAPFGSHPSPPVQRALCLCHWGQLGDQSNQPVDCWRLAPILVLEQHRWERCATGHGRWRMGQH